MCCSIQPLINYYLLFCRKTFIDEQTGHGKKIGEIYKLPELAKTLRTVAKEGADAIYNGSLTFGLVKDLKHVNGIITEEDFANYKWVHNKFCIYQHNDDFQTF